MVDVTVVPASATLMVNGEEKTLQAGGKFTQELPFETVVNLIVWKTGYKSKHKSVTLTSNNMDNKYTISLEKNNVRCNYDMPILFGKLLVFTISNNILF